MIAMRNLKRFRHSPVEIATFLQLQLGYCDFKQTQLTSFNQYFEFIVEAFTVQNSKVVPL